MSIRVCWIEAVDSDDTGYRSEIRFKETTTAADCMQIQQNMPSRTCLFNGSLLKKSYMRTPEYLDETNQEHNENVAVIAKTRLSLLDVCIERHDQLFHEVSRPPRLRWISAAEHPIQKIGISPTMMNGY